MITFNTDESADYSQLIIFVCKMSANVETVQKLRTAKENAYCLNMTVKRSTTGAQDRCSVNEP